MSRHRFYIKTFSKTGTYESDFTEITTDVLNVNKVKNDLDNNEFDIGIFKNSNIKLNLRNDHGRFSDENILESMFPVQRDESVVKVTWDLRNYDTLAGFISVPFLAGEEITIFEGLLNDVGQKSSIDKQEVDMTVIGYESLFDRVEVPFSSIAVGELASSIIYKTLNQTKITTLLTVDASNITLGQDETLDNIDDLENATGKEALEELLKITNSVLYIKDQTIYISTRDESADLKFTFYGQGSDSGIENIIDISKYREGKNRIFNFWTWKDTSTISRDTSSLDLYGVRKKEISTTYYTDTDKIQRLLDSGRDEFSFPKREFILKAPLNYDTVALNLLDKVSVDYPVIYTSATNSAMPIYGEAVYGVAKAPYGQFSLNIESTARFKILSKTIDLKNETISFEMRET